jgi:hypothetical protein
MMHRNTKLKINKIWYERVTAFILLRMGEKWQALVNRE